MSPPIPHTSKAVKPTKNHFAPGRFSERVQKAFSSDQVNTLVKKIRTQKWVRRNKPSSACYAETRALRSEFDDLFSGFTADKQAVKAAQLAERNRRLCGAALKRASEVRKQVQLALEKSRTILSLGSAYNTYAGRATVGAKPDESCHVIVVDPTWHAEPAWKQADSERRRKRAARQQARRAAYEQRLAIRRATLARKQAREAKAVRREIALLAKKALAPREVKVFPKQCYYVESEPQIAQHYGFVRQPKVAVKPNCNARPTSVRQVRRPRVIPETNWSWEPVNYPQPKPEGRLSRLSGLFSQLGKTTLGQNLLMAILVVKCRRSGTDLSEIVSQFSKLQPQMNPEPAQGSIVHSEHQASNTAIDVVQPVDRGIPVSTMRGFQDLAVSKEKQHFQSLADRWIYVDTFEWKTSHQSRDTLVYSVTAPKGVLKDNYDSQNAQLFLLHRWFRGSMRIRLCLNSNPFQVGQLVASWVYMARESSVPMWDNVYSGLQRNHCLLNAGSSNDAELLIPYRNIDSMMSLTEDAILGLLSVRVLNPLVVTAGVATSCRVAVFVTFEDTEFYGMISRSLTIQPQMDSVANVMNAGSNLISTIRGDNNRDLPPLPLQPVSLIPQAMPSLSYVDGSHQPVNVLRADSRGQTPHVDLTDEMSLSSVLSKWGLLACVNWTTKQPVDSKLFSTPVVPVLDQDRYVDLRVQLPGQKEVSFIPPPIAYVSGMFGLFRGDIEFKIQVVASKFHTGRLIVGSVPLAKSDNLPINILKFSPFKVFDIADSSEFIFRAPWHWRNAFASTRFMAELTEIPSKLYIKVMNQLIAIDSVSPSVYLNIYVRAADNFEVAIPRPALFDPSISDSLKPPSVQYLIPYNLESTWYASWQHSISMTNGQYAQTFYIQNVSEGWCGYTNIQRGKVYKLRETTTKGLKFRCYYKSKASNSNDIRDVQIRYGVGDPDLATANAAGLIVFETAEKARAFADAIAVAKSSEERQAARQAYCDPWVQDGDWSQVYVSGKWIQATDTNDPPIWEQKAQSWVLVEPQMEDQGVPVTSLDIPSGVSGFGRQVFGETAPDLKSLGRRFNHLASVKFESRPEVYPRDSPVAAVVRVTPFRRVDPATSASYDNRHRHGIITAISQMYRLWRGGLRYRFVVVGSPPEGTVLYVQHRFDVSGPKCDQYVLVNSNHAMTDRNTLMNTQYATFSQVLSVNSAFTIEIPYYNPHEALSLMTDDPCQETDNGTFFMWVHAKEKYTFNIEVFYSLADDCRFSVFQGVPACRDLSTLVPEPQMDVNPFVVKEEDKLRIQGQGKLVFPKEKPIVLPSTSSGEPQGIASTFGRIFGKVKDTIQAPAKVAEQVATLTEDASEASHNITASAKKLSKVLDGINEFLGNVKAKVNSKISDKAYNLAQEAAFSLLANAKDSIFSFLSHFVYMILSPTIKTIAWGLLNIYHFIFGFSMKGFEVISNFVKEAFNRATAPSKLPQGASVEPQAEFNCLSAYSSLIFFSISSFCRLKATPPTSWKGISEGLFQISQGTKGSSFVGQFVSDNVELFKRVYYKLLSYFGSPVKNFDLITGLTDQRLRSWVLEASLVVAPQSESNVLTRSDWSGKVFELAIVGRAIEVALVRDKQVPPRLLAMVRELSAALRKLEKKLLDSKVFSGIRYEPFCFWAAGGAGTGKSRFVERLAIDLAARANYTGHTSYHSISAGQKYFDGFVGQPTVVIDDFVTMSPQADPEGYLQFLQMKSSALFNPPYSIAEDKTKLVNFFNLIVTSNWTYMANLPGINEYDAFNRRRDLLLVFKFKDPGMTAEKVPSSYTEQQMIDGEQYEVFVPASVLSEGASQRIEPIEGEAYSETVRKYVMRAADAYHERQSRAYSRAMKEVLRMLDSSVFESESFTKVLETYVEQFESYSKNGAAAMAFSRWLTTSKEKASFTPPVPVEPQADDNPFITSIDRLVSRFPENEEALRHRPPPLDPANPLKLECWPFMTYGSGMDYTDLDTYPENCVIPPLKEDVRYHSCLHLTFDYAKLLPICFDEGLGDINKMIYCNPSLFHDGTPRSVPHGQCYYKDELGVLKPLPDCSFVRDPKRYLARIGLSQQYATESVNVLSGMPDRFHTILMHSDVKYFFRRIRDKLVNDTSASSTQIQFLVRALAQMQQTFAKSYVKVGNTYLPVESPDERSFARKVWDGLLTLFDIIYKLLVGLLAAVSLFVTIWCLVTIVRKSYDDVNDDLEPNLHPSGDYKTIRSGRTVRQRSLKLVQGNAAESTSTEDVIAACKAKTQISGLIRKIVRNTFHLVGRTTADAEGNFLTYTMRCVGLYNRNFLVLKHYIEHFKANNVETVSIVYHDGDAVITYPLSVLEFVWTEQGYGVGTLPASAPRQFANITKFMPSDKFDGNYPRDCIMLEIFSDSFIQHSVSIKKIDNSVVVPASLTSSKWVINQGCSYSWGGKGKCGSLLIAPSMASPLIGVHTAGIGEILGYSEFLLRETFVQDDDIPIEFITPQMDIKENVYGLDGEYSQEGQLDRDMIPSMSLETRIRPSEIAGVFPIYTEPAPLANNDPRLCPPSDILRIGVSKRCDPLKEFPMHLVQEVYLNLYQKMQVHVKSLRSSIRPLSVKQAVEGFETEGYESMEMSTSEGYPWVRMRPSNHTNKRWLFNLDFYPSGRVQLLGIHPDLDSVLKVKAELRLKGIVPASYFTACLKDARILKEKCSIPGKTRVFEISPVDLTIVQRQYFQDFFAAYRISRFEHTIGINPDGPEWTKLAQDLQLFSPFILTADFSGYGPRLSHELGLRAFDLAIGWLEEQETSLTEEEKDEAFITRKVIAYEVMKGLHIVKDLVFRPTSGLPSGNCNTVELNSAVNSFYWRLAFLVLAAENAPHYASLYWFNLFVLLFHNGDDIIASVKSEIISWFNNETLIEFFSRFGLKMTDALKEGKVRPHCTILEASYLKRGFLPHPSREGQFLAPLEKTSILDTASWIWKSIDERQASLVNSEMCCRLAYTRGPEFYNEVVHQITTAWLKRSVSFEAPSWASLDSHIWDNTPGPIYHF